MDFKVKQVVKRVGAYLKRFHLTIFVVTIFGSLAVAVFVLSSILQDSTNTSAEMLPSSNFNTKFDQETIDRLNSLRTRNDNASDISLPPGRINPFTE